MNWGRRFFRLLRFACIVALIALIASCLPSVVVKQLSDGKSQCFGEESSGSLSNGRKLRGTAYAGRPYCKLCSRWLRTYAHSAVSDAVFGAYFGLVGEYGQQEFRKTDWVWGESGWPWGGLFYPHASHQNGLSVDFLVPLKNGVRFPTKMWNRFGYGVEFDENGAMVNDGLGDAAGAIDFHAMAEHLLELNKYAQRHGGGIRRVFFAGDLLDNLFASPNGHLVRATIQIADEAEHASADEHYHVDFDFPCAEE